MTEDRQRNARRIFMEVADLAAEARETALENLCGDDVQVRAEVEALLRADAQAGRFMAAPTSAPPSDATRIGTQSEREGQMIGRYKLLQPIGEGGFGVVWMAEQREPVKRRVALKVIKLGMDTRQVIARFEAERQALAMMDHPNIAKVLDAGSTDTGRPYFVMEYIKGVPILEYCEVEKLDTRARLTLFAAVCNAIQHAHQKGIIHRDIKPGNVLVTMHDGVPVPKVIDFGIAKAASLELTAKTLFTEHRQMIGTPAYMSPEQAEMSGLDIDTRSDIYSLGVLLYELLTGTTPFSHAELLSAGYAEMMRIIREVEPAKPSTRLNTLGATATTAASQRLATDTRKLTTIIQGDLDWIVMKCLEKDRTRRYETASNLAADILRHLKDEPVTAGPPSGTYRFQKFVRRHRAQVIAASLFIGALIAGIIGTTYGLVEARSSASAERAARTQAETNLTFARTGNRILGSVFADLAPGNTYATIAELRAALRDNLNAALQALDESSIGSPIEVAAMQDTLGRSLLALGEASKSVTILEKAAATRASALGPTHADTLSTRSALASALQFAGRTAEALPIVQDIYTLQTQSLGQGHRSTIQSMQQLSILLATSRQFDHAISLATQARDLCVQNDGPSSESTFIAIRNLALVHGFAGSYDLSLPLYKDVYEHQLALHGPVDPRTLTAQQSLAIAYNNTGRVDLAIPLFEAVFSQYKVSLGRDHPSTLITMGNLANAYNKSNRPDLALVIYEETLKLRRAKLGPDHPETIGGLNHLAGAYWGTGQHDAALALYEEATAANLSKFGPHHIDTLRGQLHLAQLYLQRQKPDRASSLLQAALKATTDETPESLRNELSETLARVPQASPK